MSDLLFAYGTLMRGLPLHHLLEGRARFVATGSVRGRLLDLGRYPGAVADAEDAVRGEVYRLEGAGVLGTLDAAEGPEFPRRLAPVRLDDGRETLAWVYWFAGPAGRGVPIPGGDWRRHLEAHPLSKERAR